MEERATNCAMCGTALNAVSITHKWCRKCAKKAKQQRMRIYKLSTCVDCGEASVGERCNPCRAAFDKWRKGKYPRPKTTPDPQVIDKICTLLAKHDILAKVVGNNNERQHG